MPGQHVATRAVRQHDAFIDVLIRIHPPLHSTAYAIEENVTPGLAASDISHGGIFHSHLNSIRWGPFLDNEPRDLTYKLVAQDVDELPRSFDGVVSFDGRDTRIQGQSEITTLRGDADHDGDVDLADYLQLVECFSPAANSIGAGCKTFDFDDDSDVDLADFVAFQSAFTGPR